MGRLPGGRDAALSTDPPSHCQGCYMQKRLFAVTKVCCKAPTAPSSHQTPLQSCIYPLHPWRTPGAARLGGVGGRKKKGYNRTAQSSACPCKASRIAASKPHDTSTRSPRGTAGDASMRPPRAVLALPKGEQRVGSALPASVSALQETLQRACCTAPSSCCGNLLSRSLQ